MSFRFAVMSDLRNGAFFLARGLALALAASSLALAASAVSAQAAAGGTSASAPTGTTAGATGGASAAGGNAQAGHGSARGSSARAGRLSVESAWARATPPGAAVAGGFLIVRNEGDGDRLVAAESPAAGRVELHTMSMQDNVMRMRKLESIELPAGERVELRPGGHHLMFMDLQGPLKEGDTFPIRLRFEKAGEVEVQVQVRSMGAQAGSH